MNLCVPSNPLNVRNLEKSRCRAKRVILSSRLSSTSFRHVLTFILGCGISSSLGANVHLLDNEAIFLRRLSVVVAEVFVRVDNVTNSLLQFLRLWEPFVDAPVPAHVSIDQDPEIPTGFRILRAKSNLTHFALVECLKHLLRHPRRPQQPIAPSAVLNGYHICWSRCFKCTAIHRCAA